MIGSSISEIVSETVDANILGLLVQVKSATCVDVFVMSILLLESGICLLNVM